MKTNFENLKNEVTRKFEDLVETYLSNAYFVERHGLEKMFDLDDGVFWKAKTPLFEAFEEHPDYNGKGQIVLRNMRRFRVANPKVAMNAINHIDDKILSLCYEARSRRDMKAGDAYWACDDIVGELKAIMSEEGGISLSDEGAERLQRKAGAYGHKIRFGGGQKYARALQKICAYFKITDWKNLREETFTTAGGETRTRMVDHGYNKYFTAFADAMSPLEIRYTAILSINPIDYLTMSFGYKWSSCHTIDKDNLRWDLNGENHYSGMYCGGCESYMNDTCSMIFYYLPEDWSGEEPELERKMKRCVFMFGEDKLLQGRVYPDGRNDDPGLIADPNVAKYMRAVVQAVLSQIFHFENNWRLEKGTEACGQWVTTKGGVQYPDYLHYEDCTISFIKGRENFKRIKVGVAPICPECGWSHGDHNNIFCEDCAEGVACDCCGRICSRGQMEEIGDGWYCPDCTFICPCCGDLCALSDTDPDDLNICHWCGQHNIYSEYHDTYIDREDMVVTYQGDVFATGDEGDGYCTCSRCEEHYTISSLFRGVRRSELPDWENWLCQECVEQDAEV